MKARPRRGADSVLHWMVLAVSLLVIVGAFVLQVRDKLQVCVPGFSALPELCWLRKATGIACPGCGMTRSFISLAHGRFEEAWQFNPAGPFFFLLIASQLPYRTWQIWRVRTGKAELEWRFWQWMPLGIVLTIMFAQWIWIWLVVPLAHQITAAN